MRTIILTIIFTLLLVPVISAQPQDIRELGLKGIALTRNLQFDEANKIFDKMIRIDPENALGYLLKSSSFLSMTEIKGIEIEQAENFKDQTLKVIDIAEEMFDENKDDVDVLFYLGCGYGNLGIYYMNNNSWLRAYWNGRKGKKYLEKAIGKNPDYYDAYLGLGMYKYYAAVLPKIIKPLSFLLGMEGDRGKGIEEVTLALKKGSYARDSAKVFLADSVHWKEENYEAALLLYKELITEFPRNHYFQMRLAICYRVLKKYDLSLQTIENSLKSESINGYPYLRNQLYYNLEKAYSEMKEYDQAIPGF